MSKDQEQGPNPLDVVIADLRDKQTYLQRVRKENPKEYARQLSQVIPADLLGIVLELANETSERTDILLGEIGELATALHQALERLTVLESTAPSDELDEELLDAAQTLSGYVLGLTREGVPDDVWAAAQLVADQFEETDEDEPEPVEAVEDVEPVMAVVPALETAQGGEHATTPQA